MAARRLEAATSRKLTHGSRTERRQAWPGGPPCLFRNGVYTGLYLAATNEIGSNLDCGGATNNMNAMEDLIVCSFCEDPEVIFGIGQTMTLWPEHPGKFHPVLRPLLSWTESFYRRLQVRWVHVRLNTSTRSSVSWIAKKLEQCSCAAEVYWYYEEEDEDIQRLARTTPPSFNAASLWRCLLASDRLSRDPGLQQEQQPHRVLMTSTSTLQPSV